MINHWIYANRFRRYMASPFNGLMSSADSTGTWIRRNNDQLWQPFWNLISLARAMGEDGDMWGTLFRGALGQITPVPKRVGKTTGVGETVWDTGDASLGRIGAINWGTREYIRG